MMIFNELLDTLDILDVNTLLDIVRQPRVSRVSRVSRIRERGFELLEFLGFCAPVFAEVECFQIKRST